MIGRQKNLKSDGDLEMIIGISVQNMGTHMRGGISTSKGRWDGVGENKTIEDEVNRSRIAHIGPFDPCSRRKDYFVPPTLDRVVEGFGRPDDHRPSQCQPAIDWKKKIGMNIRSTKNKMMRRRGNGMNIHEAVVSKEPSGMKEHTSSGKNECNPFCHKGSSFKKGRFFERVTHSFLLLPGLLLFLANPANSFAEKDDPFLYAIESKSNSENLVIVSGTLHASGNVELPTTIYLPSSALRKIGMDHPEGWDYEARTVNAPLYTSKKEGDRSIVTEIEIIALPKAKKADLVVLDEKNRVFILHLVPHPKTMGNEPFYSRDVSWWPATGSFSSEGLRPLGNDPAQHSSHPTQNGDGNHVR